MAKDGTLQLHKDVLAIAKLNFTINNYSTCCDGNTERRDAAILYALEFYSDRNSGTHQIKEIERMIEAKGRTDLDLKVMEKAKKAMKAHVSAVVTKSWCTRCRVHGHSIKNC